MQKLQQHAIVILLVISFLIGIVTLPDRGEGWDEASLNKYTVRSLQAYQTWLPEGKTNITLEKLGNYGPAYVMLAELVFRLLDNFLPIHPVDIHHLIYFTTYLAGIWAFHDLARRWMPPVSSLGATALLMFQPVLWGHSFMNPKDIPFLAVFLLSVTFGMRMIDSVQAISLSASTERIKRLLVIFTVFWLLSVFGLIASTGMIHSLIDSLVRSAASGRTNIVSLVASHIETAPPEVYIQKFFVLFIQVRAVYIFLLTVLLVYLYYRHSRATLHAIFPILVPGILLGFTSSVRVLGPFAGVLVAAYGLYTKGRKAVPALFLYAVIGFISMYLTWPYLWENPVAHFLESAWRMSSYPWIDNVLFLGQRHPSTEPPYSYLPVLLGIQLTEPVWFLFLAGLTSTIIGAWAGQKDKRILLGLVLVWFVFPTLYFILARPTLYDNFRQILFILPPVFLMAGIAFSMIRNQKWQVALIALVLLPGMVEGVRLYPYEYIYYNRFIGGVHGAFRRFDLDYWGTSYREAAEIVNRAAAPNSYVYVEGPTHLFEPFARSDLKVLEAYDPVLDGEDYYLVTLTRYDLDLLVAPEAKIEFTIARDGVPLTVIKKP